jgi:hypothetical protein
MSKRRNTRRRMLFVIAPVPAQTFTVPVDADGFGDVLVRALTNTPLGASCAAGWAQHVGVTLLRVSPTGSVSPTSVYSQSCNTNSGRTLCDEGPELLELFPDGIGGSLLRTRYVTAVDGDPFSLQPYTSETRLMRVHGGSVQFSNVVDHDERIMMIGDAGTAFLGGDDVRAVDVINWTPRWVNANTLLEPVAALLNGKAAMHDTATGQLIEFSETGAAGASGAFGERWGYQFAYGIWINAVSGVLVARKSLALDQVLTSFVNLGGIGTQQQAPRRRLDFGSVAAAAIGAFEFVYDYTSATPWEWGGVICQQGSRFTFSRIVTNNDNGSVRTVEQPGLTADQINALPTCAPYASPVPVGAFHLHTASGQPYPPGFGPGGAVLPHDLNTAAQRPELTFFALTPGGPAPRGTNIFMYQAREVQPSVWSAYNNTFIKVNNQWMAFTPPPQ